MNKNRLKNCAYNILDNTQAIIMEANREKPYSGYLLEKIRAISSDIKVIEAMCMKEEKNNG